MKDIFIICWTGRDSESGVWDTYPCFNYGYYTDCESAQTKADELNATEPREYDEDAEDIETYVVQVITAANTRGNK